MQYIKDVPNKNFANIDTPVGDLEWVMITGQGKLNTLNNKYYYQVTLLLDEKSDECKALVAEIEGYWKDNPPSKKWTGKEASTLGFKTNMVKTGEIDETTEEPILEPDGRIAFMFKTETAYKDGNAKVIKVANAKGAEVALGDRKVGNGSRGRVKGVITTYEQPKDAGTSLYLNSLQLAKFVPFTGGAGFDEIDTEEDDAFEGFDGEEAPIADEKDSASSKPRL